jgi:methylmalonyl-CoA mutase N-terminal domain/subunit
VASTTPAAEAKKAAAAVEPTTLSGIPIKTVYDASDLKGRDLRAETGDPGAYPFTRGLPYARGMKPGDSRKRHWTMRQFAGHKTAKDTNERFKYLLAHGETGLATAFDLPTLMGLDSDDPQSLGEVGREGVAVDSLADMEALFAGIDLSKVSTSMTINLPAPIILAMFFAVAKKQKVPLNQLRGTCQTDILKEYIAQNEYLYPPEPSMRLVLDTIEYCVKELPRFYPISISGYHIREAGADAVQELAFTLADGRDYVERLIKRGLNVDDFAPQLSFFFDVHNCFFEEIAKLRAARSIWAKLMKDEFGAKKPISWMLPMHCQTAGVSLTAQQPLNNLVRVAYQAMAAVLGGTQSLHTNSFDEALALPTDEAVMLALRTQQLIAYETGVTDTLDPFGGSYYLETLTKDVEERATALMKRIKDLGGVVPALETGFFHREIAETAYQFEKDLGSSRRKIVGVNIHAGDNKMPPILKIDSEVEEGQVRSLKKVRAERDNANVASCLARLKECARGSENLMPIILETVEAYGTVGEITAALKETFGEYPVFAG